MVDLTKLTNAQLIALKNRPPPVSPRVSTLTSGASEAKAKADAAVAAAVPQAVANVRGQQLSNTKTAQEIETFNALNRPVDLDAENRRRVVLQAKTGMPYLDANYDPYRDYLNSRTTYTDKRNASLPSIQAFINQDEAAIKKTNVDKLDAAAEGVLAAYAKGVRTGGVWRGLTGPLSAMIDPASGAFGVAAAAAKGDLRVPGDVISNYDARNYSVGAPGLDKPEEFNRAWAMSAKATKQRVNDYRAFRDAFVATNGAVTGLQTMWNKYNDSNPIYAKNDKGKPVYNKVSGLPILNPNRVSWQEFYKNRAQTRLEGGKLPEEMPKDDSDFLIEELPQGER